MEPIKQQPVIFPRLEETAKFLRKQINKLEKIRRGLEINSKKPIK